MDRSEPRGIRNNNPMNVRKTATQWVGEVEGADPGYETFATAGDGIRAGARVLVNYQRLHGLTTIRGIISRWAPPSDNNPTDKYIEFTARRLDVGPDRELDLENLDTLVQLVAAIIQFENGKQPYTMAYIRHHAARAV